MRRLHNTRRLALVLFFVLATANVRTAAADSLTVMWDPSPDSTVAGYVVYVGTQPGVYPNRFDVGTATFFALTTAVAGQQYYFSVAAYVPGPVLGPGSAEVSGFTNAAPVLTKPANQTGTVGRSATLQLAGSDPYGQPLSYGAGGLPPGLEIVASTGFISGTPTTAGTYQVTATASDGALSDSEGFTWTVNPAETTSPPPPERDSTAPVITITAPTRSETYATNQIFVMLGGTAVDDTRVTEVTWSNGRASGRVSGTSRWITGILLQRGSNLITIKARDAAGNVSTRAIVVTSSGRSR